jgi:hypothetical protein
MMLCVTYIDCIISQFTNTPGDHAKLTALIAALDLVSG